MIHDVWRCQRSGFEGVSRVPSREHANKCVYQHVMLAVKAMLISLRAPGNFTKAISLALADKGSHEDAVYSSAEQALHTR